MSQQNQTAAIQQLTIEVANAYKIASDRAEFQIQTLNQERSALLKQVEAERNTNKSLRVDVAELQKQIDQLHSQLGALQLQLDSHIDLAPGDNVAGL